MIEENIDFEYEIINTESLNITCYQFSYWFLAQTQFPIATHSIQILILVSEKDESLFLSSSIFSQLFKLKMLSIFSDDKSEQ